MGIPYMVALYKLYPYNMITYNSLLDYLVWVLMY